MIVQALHQVQKRNNGHLPRKALEVLSEEINTPLHRLQEVASFFPHFRLESDKPADVEVLICHDMACHLAGSNSMRQWLKGLESAHTPERVQVRPVSCLGRCDRAPACTINGHLYVARAEAELRRLVAEAAAAKTGPERDTILEHHANRDTTHRLNTIPNWRVDPYAGTANYEAVRAYIRDPHPEWLLKELEIADLRGMGGAGVPAHRKWRDVWQARGNEKYVVVNGDESEPATFKDREILLRKPHLVLEGVLLAGAMFNATKGFVYIRHEYEECIEAMRREIRRAESMGLCGDSVAGTNRSFPVEVFVSPGGYICGEQSALIEAMEDRRAEPRNKPPELLTNGLYDKPTLVSNVETFAWVPAIARRGGAWYAAEGKGGWKGRRYFSVSGDVRRPGVYEVPVGTTVRELLYDCCWGMKDDRRLKAFAPSGPSGGFLPARIPVKLLPPRLLADRPAVGKPESPTQRFVRERLPEGSSHLDLLDLEMDLQLFRDCGLMLGAGVAFYAEGTDIVDHSLNALEFFRNESCGKCVPCRLGSQKLVETATRLHRRGFDPASFEAARAAMRELARTMEVTSICGLGGVAATPFTNLLQYFPDEVERYLKKS